MLVITHGQIMLATASLTPGCDTVCPPAQPTCWATVATSCTYPPCCCKHDVAGTARTCLFPLSAKSWFTRSSQGAVRGVILCGRSRPSGQVMVYDAAKIWLERHLVSRVCKSLIMGSLACGMSRRIPSAPLGKIHHERPREGLPESVRPMCVFFEYS